MVLTECIIPSAQKVHEWEPIPVEELREDHAVIYDHWDPDNRAEVDLTEVPLVDDLGQEIRLYSAEGMKIARRDALLDEKEDPCGILINLATIETAYTVGSDNIELMYGPDDEDGDVRIDQSAKIEVSVFPLVYLRTFGHIQTNGVLPAFNNIIKQINERFKTNPTADQDPRKVLTPVASQGYNELSHRAAPCAGAHETQQGWITAALAGAYATTARAQREAKKKYDYCEAALPFDRFIHKIDVPGCPRALRMEQVFNINVKAMPPRKRTGRCAIYAKSKQFGLLMLIFLFRHVYNQIILPLSNAWSRPEVFERLKPHLLALEPEVCPFWWLDSIALTLVSYRCSRMYTNGRLSASTYF
jgi:hypothetical protein